MPRFCFYSEYRDIKGGYTTLIFTLASELYKQGYEVLLINFKDGLIQSELQKTGIEVPLIDLDNLNRSNASQFIQPDDILIIPRFYERLKVFMDVNPRVVYYDINDFIGSISDYKFGIRLPSLGKKLIQQLLDSNGLIFMDDTGIKNVKREFGIEVSNPVLVPISIPDEPENLYLKRDKKPGDVINVTYIGRCVDWKMYPLKKILDDTVEAGERIYLRIVVDDVKPLGQFIDVDHYRDDKISIEVYENLLPSEIRSFLISNTDLYFGMGTTVIHAAGMGIPTVLMDYSTRELPGDYSYRWLFETEYFSLGKNLEKEAPLRGLSIKELYDLIRDDEIRNLISLESFRYVFNSHSASSVTKSLAANSLQSAFRLKDASGLVPFYYYAHALLKNISVPFTKKKIV